MVSTGLVPAAVALMSMLTFVAGSVKEPRGPGVGEEHSTCTEGDFFGASNKRSGLQCEPECGSFAPSFDDAFVADLRSRTLLNPPAELTSNPYDDPAANQPQDDKFCGVLLKPQGDYELRTFPTFSALTAGGAKLTHTGACGVCSPLADLATLIEVPDQTQAIRRCVAFNTFSSFNKLVDCIVDIGFTRPCAQISAYNGRNTAKLRVCGPVCIASVFQDYVDSNGELNRCLACDEEKSGPVFRGVAGRIRRNSGVPGAICRRCENITCLLHKYH